MKFNTGDEVSLKKETLLEYKTPKSFFLGISRETALIMTEGSYKVIKVLEDRLVLINFGSGKSFYIPENYLEYSIHHKLDKILS